MLRRNVHWWFRNMQMEVIVLRQHMMLRGDSLPLRMNVTVSCKLVSNRERQEMCL